METLKFTFLWRLSYLWRENLLHCRFICFSSFRFLRSSDAPEENICCFPSKQQQINRKVPFSVCSISSSLPLRDFQWWISSEGLKVITRVFWGAADCGLVIILVSILVLVQQKQFSVDGTRLQSGIHQTLSFQSPAWFWSR